VERSAAGSFSARLASHYQARTGLKPEIYICKPSDGARVIG
jgi:galactokinase